jgi:hypothetical protein
VTIAVPPGADGAPGWVIPDDDAADEDMDVRSPAGTQPPAGGAWLWVTTVAGRHAGQFTALPQARSDPRACGGDVLLHVTPGRAGYLSGAAEERETAGPSGPAGAGSLAHVAGWDHLNARQWPEQVCGTVAFAVGAVRELREHGAGIGIGEVAAEPAARSVAYGLPALPARADAAGG